MPREHTTPHSTEMASRHGAGAILAATAVATAVALAILAVPATGVATSDGSGPRSYLTSWGGSGCTSSGSHGRMASVGSCGCNRVRFHGGHEFNFRGETATLYSKPGCAGTPYQVFEDTRACGDFGWHSIHIDC
ncbi:hypothetical protein PVAP13_7KG316815 [Panicum virgatum]|uniref:Uncharacterized protein n=1 Tax=Panicum virgatum TaxID=38727 RepID=A0A8T0QGK8_PANVG|nr:hypothetical protein PVAP13_7KG314803 [Panicum virgatum]KAG2574237.1 hypothetical protein PVAP13_7KG316815 [Panicum virgatum]